MRRITTTLGTLAAGALLAVALPAASANAAQGMLLVNGMQQMNPQGCVQAAAQPMDMAVANLTDHIVLVHLLPNCQGEVTSVIVPQSSMTQIGSSIEVMAD